MILQFRSREERRRIAEKKLVVLARHRFRRRQARAAIRTCEAELEKIASDATALALTKAT
jgi:hypothetical protein